ncbi:UvrD-helicase domain-containing protein [Fodinibius salsisoli]|uniref:DNA 3'-5' helicase II n=1 Tax=Fodinibius salsisoli TaxID=2820877 RepID=A0ABT3PL35_9BACT|nr:UvrD-helicase domain-containing protein [Fodinibius salsisoli]MCW9706433.1 UvrD-helicase domain-containing protein [Fodinibius salsisoli]
MIDNDLNISDQDIASIEKIFGFSFTEDNRDEVLKSLSNLDVQAGPGSGKTTLLVAKLAILAQKWKWSDRGICVLSHTNVAREEIEKRLSKIEGGLDLLGYPHFIGTIQSFINNYFALPLLRNKGIEISFIDNKIFSENALELLQYKYNARRTLSHKYNGERIASTLEFEGSELDLTYISRYGRKQLPWGKDIETYQELKEIKLELLRKGILRFNDMYAFSEYYLAKFPSIKNVINTRFPLVFIDEIQDSNFQQDKILKDIFSEGSTVQKLGDINQSIYSGNQGSLLEDFPYEEKKIEVKTSKRFGNKIANSASYFTAINPQQLVGFDERNNFKNTIFLFDKNSIAEVLPSFCELVIDEFGKLESKSHTVKAIGLRKSDSRSQEEIKQNKNFPYLINDYFADFNEEITTSNINISYLIDYVFLSRYLLKKDNEFKESYDLLLKGVLRILSKSGSKTEEGKRYSKRSFIRWLNDVGKHQLLNKIFYDCLELSLELNKENWEEIVSSIFEIIGILLTGDNKGEVKEFVKYLDESSFDVSKLADGSTKDLNTYSYSNDELSIQVDLSTIHSIKGETHDATLILETYMHGHDLSKLVESLKGNREKVKKRKEQRMRNIFVGMTRPKYLLCLAMYKENITDDDIEELDNAGWNIEDLIKN